MIIPFSMVLPMTLQTADPSWVDARTPPPSYISSYVENIPTRVNVGNLIYGQNETSLIDIENNREPSKKEKIEGKITSYLTLEEGWDGYGGRPPTNQAIIDGLMWLSLLPTGYALPKSMLSGAGEVGLYWDADGFYCDIGFFGDGTFSYYAEAPDGSTISNETIEVKDTPASLFALLSKIGVA